jgi:hypothetical protein
MQFGACGEQRACVALDAFGWGARGWRSALEVGGAGEAALTYPNKPAAPATTGLSAAPPPTLIYVWLQAFCLETERVALLAKPASRVILSAALRVQHSPAVQTPQPNGTTTRPTDNLHIKSTHNTTVLRTLDITVQDKIGALCGSVCCSLVDMTLGPTDRPTGQSDGSLLQTVSVL